MGDTRRRLSAAFVSLAIATTALGFVAPSATAAPNTTTTSEQTPSPSLVATESPAPASPAPAPSTTEAVKRAPSTARALPSASTPPDLEQSAPAAAKTPAKALAGGASTAQSILADLTPSYDVAPTYDRSYFTHWIDDDGDGCDTRAEVLKAESLAPVTYSSGCTVATGQWYSWYDGATWSMASDVDIDHMVPLSEAWKSGAWGWTTDQRTAFANDLGYAHALEAVTDNVNQSKSDRDPTSWMPTLDQCQYVIDWVTQKWRWNLGVDDSERALLGTYLNGTQCGTTTVALPTKMIASNSGPQLWPLSKIVYDATIYELVMTPDGSQNPVPLSYEKWRDVYKLQYAAPAATDFVKYPWSPTVYAVTFWPGGENAWMWTPLSYKQWVTAYTPAPRNAGWIKGSYYYQWGTSSELFVEGADGVNHQLSYQEWADSGFRDYLLRSHEGYMKLTWAPELARMSDLTTGNGRPMGYGEWQEEAFPTPRSVQRITGDSFYQDYGSTSIWYAGPGMNRSVSYNEWRSAGSPSPTIRNGPNGGGGPPSPTQPGNPGDTKNCTDFATQGAAQNWFNTYFPYYGDVAKLDGDNNGIACESLPR